MFELDPASAAGYLRQLGFDDAEAPWRVRALGGGVSNTVLLAESGSRRWVLKQSLGQLRVAEVWFADRQRIWRESAAISTLKNLLPEGAVPGLVFEDAENFVYAMEAAPAPATDWKTHLLKGDINLDMARQTGAILAALIRASTQSDTLREQFRDQTCFRQLRLDPYYRFLADRYPELRGRMEEAIAVCESNRIALVHGDFSPKNLLVSGGRIMVIDFEVIHFGDPGFDVAFLLNHLLLKAAHRPELRPQFLSAAQAFWNELKELKIDTAMRHIGCLHLARVDGKSPAEYLSEQQRVRVRKRAMELIAHPPRSVEEMFAS